MWALALFVVAAGLQPSLHKPMQKDESYVASYAQERAGETEPVKEITRRFGFKLQDGQTGMCKMLLFVVCAGILAQCVKSMCELFFKQADKNLRAPRAAMVPRSPVPALSLLFGVLNNGLICVLYGAAQAALALGQN